MSFLTTLLKAASPLIPASVRDHIARQYFNHHYGSFGTMTKLQIDFETRRAIVEFELKGETQPLLITISRYELTVADGKTFIEVHELTTSREWLTLLGQRLLKGRKFELPEEVASVL